MSFRGDILRPDDEVKMSAWEMRVYEYATHAFDSVDIEMFVLGNEIVDVEMNRDAQKTAPYFSMGNTTLFTRDF